jgi:LPXTG-motif cell wall-anchored protein
VTTIAHTLPSTGAPTVPLAAGGVLLLLGGLFLVARSRPEATDQA